MSLRLVFMGTPDFAATALRALADSPHEIIGIYTQPPRPAGRGHREHKSPVHRLGEERNIPVRTPHTLKEPEEQAAFAALGADVAVVAAYGLILPPPILDAPRLGCINIHASLLPRWRGAAPIQRAIMAGDSESGITIMRMDEGLDTGPILLSESLSLDPTLTGGALHELLSIMGARLIVSALDRLETLPAVAQPAEGSSYAAKLSRHEGCLDWNRPAGELERLVRALSPAPAAWFDYQGERFKVLAATVETSPVHCEPGQIVDDHLAVACGKDILRLERIQRAGKAPLDAATFLRGFPFPAGETLTGRM